RESDQGQSSFHRKCPTSRWPKVSTQIDLNFLLKIDLRDRPSLGAHAGRVRSQGTRQASVCNLQSELPGSRGRLRPRDPPEIGVGRIGVRRTEVNVIEEVERFATERRVDAFSDVELLT